MPSHGALVIIGSGPGIGTTTAAHFASQGFEHIFLLSRNKDRLAEDAKTVSSANSSAKVETHQLDLGADEATIKRVLSSLESKVKNAGGLEVVLYNAARVAPSPILDTEAQQLADDIKLTTISLYTTLQWAVPQLLESGKGDLNPAFLVTSGGLYKQPESFLFSLSAAKAAQHNLTQSFHQYYEPSIHFSAVAIYGIVSPDAKVTTPQAIAEEFWKLYSQKKGTKGKGAVEMHDPGYEEGVAGMRKQVEGK